MILTFIFLGSQTISLKQPIVLKPSYGIDDIAIICKEESIIVKSPTKTIKHKPEIANTSTQTSPLEKKETRLSSTQTAEDFGLIELISQINVLKNDNSKIAGELADAMSLAQKQSDDILHLNAQKINLETCIQTLKNSNDQRNKQNDKLLAANENLKQQLDDFKNNAISERNKSKNLANEENKSLLLLLEQVENDKTVIVNEYKELLKNEREEYSKSLKDLNIKVMELQTELDK